MREVAYTREVCFLCHQIVNHEIFNFCVGISQYFRFILIFGVFI